MTRRYARARRGVRAVGSAPVTYGQSWTLVFGLRLTGPVAPLLFRGAMDRIVWDGYVVQCLVTELEPGDIVVFDRLSAHLSPSAFAAIAGCGAQVELLPPYSPDLSPVEQCGSKVKTAMRAAEARKAAELVDAAGDALRTVTEQDAIGWFRNSRLHL